MAGSKTQNKNAGNRSGQLDRFLKGTDEQVVRIMHVSGKKSFVWGVKTADGYRHVASRETELR